MAIVLSQPQWTAVALAPSSTLTFTGISGITQGNLLVAFISKDDDVATTGPSGWTLLNSTSGTPTTGQIQQEVWYKVATASEPTSYVWTGDREDYIGLIVELGDADASSIEYFGGNADNSITPSNTGGTASNGSFNWVFVGFAQENGDIPYDLDARVTTTLQSTSSTGTSGNNGIIGQAVGYYELNSTTIPSYSHTTNITSNPDDWIAFVVSVAAADISIIVNDVTETSVLIQPDILPPTVENGHILDSTIVEALFEGGVATALAQTNAITTAQEGDILQESVPADVITGVATQPTIADISVVGGTSDVTTNNYLNPTVADISVVGGESSLTANNDINPTVADISVVGGTSDVTTNNDLNPTVADISVVGGEALPIVDFATPEPVIAGVLVDNLLGINLLDEPEAFDDVYWTASSAVAVTPSQADPFGGTDAFIVEDNSGSVAELLQVTSFAVTSGSTYTLSVFVKKDASPSVYPALVFGSAWRASIMDPSDGASKMLSWGSDGTTKVTSYNADWWRFELTGTATTTSLTDVGIYPAYNANYSDASNIAAQGVQILFGMQFEEASSASAYEKILEPTVTSNNTSLPTVADIEVIGGDSAPTSNNIETPALLATASFSGEIATPVIGVTASPTVADVIITGLLPEVGKGGNTASPSIASISVNLNNENIDPELDTISDWAGNTSVWTADGVLTGTGLNTFSQLYNLNNPLDAAEYRINITVDSVTTSGNMYLYASTFAIIGDISSAGTYTFYHTFTAGQYPNLVSIGLTNSIIISEYSWYKVENILEPTVTTHNIVENTVGDVAVEGQTSNIVTDILPVVSLAGVYVDNYYLTCDDATFTVDNAEVFCDGLNPGPTPVVTIVTDNTSLPSVADILVEGLAPGLKEGEEHTAQIGDVLVTGLVPTTNLTQGVIVNAAEGSVNAYGLLPNIGDTDQILNDVEVGSVVVFSGISPTASNNDITVAVGDVTVTGLVAPVLAGTDIIVEPMLGSIYIDAAGLLLCDNNSVLVDNESITCDIINTGIVPVATTVTANKVNSILSLVEVTGYAPSIIEQDIAQPTVGDVRVTGLRPDAIVDQPGVIPQIGEVKVTGLNVGLRGDNVIVVNVANVGNIKVTGLLTYIDLFTPTNDIFRTTTRGIQYIAQHRSVYWKALKSKINWR